MYTIKKFDEGLEYLELTNDVMHAKIALQGAHIFEFNELLWLSDVAEFREGVAIRGGIPLCWPRFGSLDKTLTQHGFARTEMFELVAIDELNSELTIVHMRLKDSSKTRKIWDKSFELDIVFELGENLKIGMKTTNRDSDAFMITQAFHSYFLVSDIKNVTIYGLENRTYFDALEEKKGLEKSAIKIDREIDRVYEGVDRDIILKDSQKELLLKTKGSASAIVWNPWIDKAKRISGMRDDAYREFVCIESANAFGDYRVLKPDETHSLSLELLIKK